MNWLNGGIGRRKGLKIPCPYGREGSSPSSATYTLVAQLVEQAAHNRPVVGSSPTGSTFWMVDGDILRV